MKDYLKKVIANLEERKDKLNKAMIKEDNAEERATIGATLEALEKEIAEAKAQLAKVGEDKPAEGNEGTETEGRSFKPVATYNKPQKRDNVDVLGSMEYRKAFMNYVQTGAISEVLQKREDVTGKAEDLGVLLPTTVIQEIMTGVEKVYGQLYTKVKKTNIKGGVKYPIGSFNATFNRIDENGVSKRQKAGAVTGHIEFSYNIGEIRIARTLLQTVLSVPAFEAEFAKVIIEAYVKAMDTEILVGVAADGQCEGILTEAAKSDSRIPAKNIIEFTAEDMEDWTAWQKKLFAVIPLAMRKERPEFVMTANTFEANIETLQDSNGQPVARNIYNPVTGDETAKFKGRDVTFVEDDILKNFNEAADGEYFGMYWIPAKGYAINTNLEFYVDHYFDKETNQYVDKALVINDGKVLDANYIYLLKKKVTA